VSAAERARLFVALELPEPVLAGLARWRDQTVSGLPGWRPVPQDALHVTLCFLGSRATEEIDAIGAAIERALDVYGPPRLSLGEGLWLPDRRPRVLAARIEDSTGVLERLQATLADALSAGGWYAPETRPFLAHATVARVRRGLRAATGELLAASSVEFTAANVTLFRSRLERGGARYEALCTVALSG
jgi:2'-5' RNA ligase